MAQNNNYKKKLEEYELKQELFNTADERYAIKLVEKIVFAMIGLILVAVVTALISLVIKE